MSRHLTITKTMPRPLQTGYSWPLKLDTRLDSCVSKTNYTISKHFSIKRFNHSFS